MRPNHVKHAWKQGKQTVGGWLNVDSVHVAETMAGLPFDWLCIDMQHGLLDYNDVRNMLPAISTTDTVPIVRVPWNEPYIIMKVLDASRRACQCGSSASCSRANTMSDSPTRITSPGRKCARSTRREFTKVPLLLPQSSICHD